MEWKITVKIMGKKRKFKWFQIPCVCQELVVLCRKAVEIMQSECCLLVEDSKDPVNEERFICIFTPFLAAACYRLALLPGKESDFFLLEDKLMQNAG